MACGKPVIAADISSLRELVETGVSGILCPKDDVEAFASACRDLTRTPEKLHAYGMAARRRIEERFAEERIIPQYLKLYRELTRT
jgi:glycosyltransferase involved in cell wall biosynthesis